MLYLDDLLAAPDFAAAAQALAADFRRDYGLGPVHQLGVVVPEVEAAAAQLEARGLGPFFIGAGKPAFWRERGEPRPFAGKLGLAYRDGLEIELLEPGHGSDFYRRSLDPSGHPVVQHLGLLTTNVDGNVARMAERGIQVYVRGQIAAGPLKTDFAYLDSEAQAGLVVEFIDWRFFGRSFSPPAGLIHFLGRLEKWSGIRSVAV